MNKKGEFMFRYFYLSVFIVFPFFLSSLAYSTQAIHANLEHITQTAEASFVGTCIDRRVELLPDARFSGGLLVTKYTFRIGQWIKGPQQKKEVELFEFVQYGATREEAAKMNVSFIIGLPQFEKNKEYVLFTTRRSPATGLSSTVGLEQGVFDVVVQANGTKSVTNKFLSTSLFQNLPVKQGVQKTLTAAKSASSQDGSVISLQSFVDLVNALGENAR